MSQKRTSTQKFKEEAVRYRKDHPELSLQKVASNLGISISALRRWTDIAGSNNGVVETRGSGNYESE